MCHFYISYVDGGVFECSHVTSVTYNGYERTVTVSEADIPTAFVPVGKALWLQSADGMCCVSGEGIRTIEISKEPV